MNHINCAAFRADYKGKFSVLLFSFTKIETISVQYVQLIHNVNMAYLCSKKIAECCIFFEVITCLSYYSVLFRTTRFRTGFVISVTMGTNLEVKV